MKKIIVSLLALVSFVGAFAGDNTSEAPQDSTVYLRATKKKTLKNIISIHPLQMIDGTVALGYEMAFNKKSSGRLILGVNTQDNNGFYDDNISNYNQWYVEGNYKLFFKRDGYNAPIGFHVAPFVSYRRATYDFLVPDLAPYIETGNSISSLGVGVFVGYTKLFFDVLTVEAHVGVGNQFVTGSNRDGKGEFELVSGEIVRPFDSGFFYKRGAVLKLGISAGVNF